MSAFIVGPETINTILSFIKGQRDNTWDVKQLAEATQLNPADLKFWDKLGTAMLDLNINAVDQRYAEKNGSKKFMFKRNPMVTRFQALKSFQCWHYQCAEGDVPETSKLYQAAERVISGMQMTIIREMPQYEAAKWG